jgi:hypothetical protein
VRAGVDVPHLLLRMARGDTPVGGLVARAGVLWRWEAGDVEALAQQAKQLVARIEGRGVVRSRLAVLQSMLDVRGTAAASPDVFAPDDPMPAVLELQQHTAR